MTISNPLSGITLPFTYGIGGAGISGGPFSPGDLFPPGTTGAWYNPSDFPDQFQTTAALVNADEAGEPVGLMLSQENDGRGIVNLLVWTDDFSKTAWDKAGTASVTGTNTLNFPAGNDLTSQTYLKTVGIGDKATATFKLSGSGTITIEMARGGAGTFEATRTQITLTATPTDYSVSHTFANAQTGLRFGVVRLGSSGDTATTVVAATGQGVLGDTALPYQANGPSLGGPGIHLYQPTAGARPTLSQIPQGGVRNMASAYSDDISQTAWTKSAVTAADEDTLLETATTAEHYTNLVSVTHASGATVSAVFLIEENGRDDVRIRVQNGSNGCFVNFTFSTATLGTPTAFGTGSSPTAAVLGEESPGVYRVRISGIAGGTTTAAWIQTYVGGASFLGDVTKGVKIYECDIIIGTAFTTHQKVTSLYNITETGKPPVWIDRHEDDYFLTGYAAFGNAVNGFYAAAGNNWKQTVPMAGFGTGTLIAQTNEASAGDRMYHLYISTAGALTINLRGEETVLLAGANTGEFHLAQINCDDGVVTVSVDGGARTTPTVGTAAAEAVPIMIGCRNSSSPAQILTSYMIPPTMLDRAITPAEEASEYAYYNAQLEIAA